MGYSDTGNYQEQAAHCKIADHHWKTSADPICEEDYEGTDTHDFDDAEEAGDEEILVAGSPNSAEDLWCIIR